MYVLSYGLLGWLDSTEFLSQTHNSLVLEANYNDGGWTINEESDSDDFLEKVLESNDKDYFNILEKIWGIQNPSDVLRGCIEKEEWFKGVVLSATFFEGIGAKVLLLRFPSPAVADKRLGEKMKAEKDMAEKIGKLSLDTIMILLYALGIINHSIYLRMVAVNQYRNKLVHRQSPFAKPEGKRSKRVIETAIKCLHKLTSELHEERRDFLLRSKGEK